LQQDKQSLKSQANLGDIETWAAVFRVSLLVRCFFCTLPIPLSPNNAISATLLALPATTGAWPALLTEYIAALHFSAHLNKTRL
jgi:hypothetical protein